MYRFLRSPKWIFGHVLVLVTVVTFANLGAWQLRRLEQRREYNALVTARTQTPPAPLDELLAAHDADALAYRRAEVTGRYAVDEEVVVTGRSLDGAPGLAVLTPLVTDDGTAILVDRGWVAYEPQPDPPIEAAAPPDGEVTVTGVLYPDEPGARTGPADAPPGELDYLTSVDLEALASPDLPPLAPVYLRLTEQEPPQSGAMPAVVAPPPLDEGPHLSYAVQWFLFTAIVLIGYPILISRTARDRARGAAPSREEVPAGSAPR